MMIDEGNIIDVDAFMDESIRLSNAQGYFPTEFMRMRDREKNTKIVLRKLVISGEIQSGFTRMLQIGLKEWTVEACVVKFSEEFTDEVVDAARWRLKTAEAKQVK